MREQTIINALQTNGPMSAAALAATLGVSRRTLQSDLRQLNEDNTGFIITVTRNVGYQLTITDSAQFAAYQASLQDQAQPAMPTKRLPALMHALLTTTEYLTVAQLAEHELISSKQLQRDLRELEKLLIGTPLQLERKAHYGIRLQGEWQSRIHAL